MPRIVQMTADDWQRVRAIRIRSLRDTPDAFASTVADESALTESQWRQRLGGPSATTFLAVDEDGARDLGLVVAAEWRGRPGCAGLFAMWVDPRARGTGVGDALVARAIQWARDGGFEQMVLEVADQNFAAVRLYERHGFVPTGNRSRLPPPRDHILEHERVLRLR